MTGHKWQKQRDETKRYFPHRKRRMVKTSPPLAPRSDYVIWNPTF